MNKKKLSALLLAGTLTAGVVGGTFAWFTSQDSVTNKFATTGTDEPNNPDAGIKIEEEFEKPENVLPGTETNKDVRVKSTAKYDQFIRVKFEKKFIKTNGDGTKTDVTDKLDTSLIELNFTNYLKDTKAEGTWFEGEDGYYYYIGKVAGGSYTNMLLDSVTLSSNAGNEYKNLEFDVTVVADSIQSSNEAYKDWAPANLQDIYGTLGQDAVAATKPSN
ncbi:MAG: BsaA family SipW-dependent biofilm matrix protein [Sarcina ventriculi]|uniref:BsaA family SipW-dependent biofilm matrix protein n=1 Tax=Sarcina ventriculi TaxID=1267 RepID=UPI001C10F96A|nr:BsaA family SipW-dependent biofilm matrix protein [Sarcina ventriculi]MBU5322675.1 BsaA family SipW-dependent biofilm matrix protein [Sarcina ventriculi]MCI5635862.1 BsaA family SipW-dependent biofilm matrix protein [Sarcina ventriculi]MDD7374308.1 BsaA family SipW-dependent biofilm matrix protein [Sarcina ventriculi]MDY7062183.1 BsaA family SipW-dependent biofilm matrix protein [Sarcina ventriculi]